jgi:DNA-binding transcriptional ArsR family regulator
MNPQANDSYHHVRADLRLAQLAQALEHPLRARLFREVGQRPVNFRELAAILDVSLSMAAYHFRVLEEVGGVARER